MRGLTRALVVGGAGFFGGRLVEELEARGVETTVLDQRGGDLVVDATEVDLTAAIDGRGVDAVFQLAGTGLVPTSLAEPLGDLWRNAGTTLAALEGARFARRPPVVAYVSSAAVYGEGREMPMREDHPLEPVSPYGISKLAAERYVALYAQLYGVPAFSVRPFSLYGPGQRKLVVYDLLVRLLGGEDPLVVGGAAEVSRDFVFVADAARSLAALARSAPARGEAYNFASGRRTTLGELVSSLLAATGLAPEVRFTGTVRPGDPVRWDGDASLARTLGAAFDTTLEDGLRLTVEWLVGSRQRDAVA